MSSSSSMRGIVGRNKERDKRIKTTIRIDLSKSYEMKWKETVEYIEFRQTLKKKQPKNIGEVSIENEKLFNSNRKTSSPIWNRRKKRQEKDCIWKYLSFIFATQLRTVGVYMNNIREDWHFENNVCWWRSPETVI